MRENVLPGNKVRIKGKKQKRGDWGRWDLQKGWGRGRINGSNFAWKRRKTWKKQGKKTNVKKQGVPKEKEAT